MTKYCVVHRTGGWEHFKWHRKQVSSKKVGYKLALSIMKDDTKEMGISGNIAFVDLTKLSVKVGLPIEFDAFSIMTSLHGYGTVKET